MPEKIAFDPRVAIPFFIGIDGKKYTHETQAGLTFPDVDTAVDFLNMGCDPRFATITKKVLETTIGETTTGPRNEYDAFVSRPEEETGEVNVMLRRYRFGDIAASAALSDFVVETTQKILESEALETPAQ